MRGVIARHTEGLRAALEVPPQTSEVRRSVALLAGLFDVVAATGTRRVHLLELGASAGLNLHLDRFRFRGPGWEFGDLSSPVIFEDPIAGNVRVVPFVIADRRGCDPHPVDAATPEGRLLLTSFVWPFQVLRHRRLAAAPQVAGRHSLSVDRTHAAGWLAEQVACSADKTLPVVWHSITQLYWPEAEIAEVDAILADYGERHPLARVAMEFGVDGGGNPDLRSRCGSPVGSRGTAGWGTAHHHGPQVRM